MRVTTFGHTRHRPSTDGFSLIEVMLVVTLTSVLAVMAIPVSERFIIGARADSSTVSAMTALTAARDRAVAERRNFELTFVAPNRIRVDRIEVPSGTKTLISEALLDNGQRFARFSSMPDTPDAFGAASAVQFSGTAPVMFTSDGSLVDSNGDVVNGSVFLGMPGVPETARAITIFGVSGLTRAWKWRGSRWME